jgi:hypothetical protein
MRTETLEIAFEEHGPADGWPVVLSHGFPYDVRAYDEVTPILASNGVHVIVPYLRGFGPTRFLSGSTMRSGQQAAPGARRRPRVARQLRRHRHRPARPLVPAESRMRDVVSASLPDQARARMPRPTSPRPGRRLWEQWSPDWRFDPATFDRTAASSTTRTSSTWSFTAIASASDWPRAIRRLPSWRTGSRRKRRLSFLP